MSRLPRWGVVFDLDGTLIDSEPYWAQGFSSGLAASLRNRHLGEHDLDVNEMRKFEGGRVPDTIAAIVGSLMLPRAIEADELSAIVQDVVDYVMQAFVARPTPIPEVVATVRGLHDAGVPLAVASSSAARFIDAALDSLGLGDAFAVRMSAFELPQGKPEPLVYSLALERLSLDPGRAIAVEDSPVGVESAVRAGMHCIWYRPGTSADNGSVALAALTQRLAGMVPAVSVSLATHLSTDLVIAHYMEKMGGQRGD